jgi:predicted ribosomally synthesized peptide with SipW-like signal peptide
MKKILGLTIAALLVIAMVAAGTFAYFSDTEQSTANTFTAGTLDLKVSNNATLYLDGVSATWADANANPGMTKSGTVTLKNNGASGINAAKVQIQFSNLVTDYINAAAVATDTGDANIDDISTVMEITSMHYGATDLLAQTTPGTFDNLDIQAADVAGNADGILTLDELDSVILGNLTTLGGLTANSTAAFSMTVTIPTTVTNGIQGDSVTTSVKFALFQNASQTL